MEILGFPIKPQFEQMLIGPINGSFYAILSLGLALIFEGVFRIQFGISQGGTELGLMFLPRYRGWVVVASLAVVTFVIMAIVVPAPLAREAVYPVLLMKLMCFALFACAFNLLLGYRGLLSCGHAAFLGSAG
jgi:hypothetical protein